MMAEDRMNLNDGEELYHNEFGERIHSNDNVLDEDELVADEATENDGAILAGDTFGETLRHEPPTYTDNQPSEYATENDMNPSDTKGVKNTKHNTWEN